MDAGDFKRCDANGSGRLSICRHWPQTAATPATALLGFVVEMAGFAGIHEWMDETLRFAEINFQ